MSEPTARGKSPKVKGSIRARSFKEGLRNVEILHVDTANSRQLYEGVSPYEKSRSQRFLKEVFVHVCTNTRGYLANQWSGDGGFALFNSSTNKEVGACVEAGKEFLRALPESNAQISTMLSGKPFRREIRIKAHRGEIYWQKSVDIASAIRENLDDFLKFEKRFAPETDELFITDEVYKVLVEKDKKSFELFKRNVAAGSLRTTLYRLRKIPKPQSDDIFKHGDKYAEVRKEDWEYLKTQVNGHFVNVAARNAITKGLIWYLDGKKRLSKLAIPSELMLDLTLDAMYAYLRLVFDRHRIRVSYWRALKRGKRTFLKIIAARYPTGEFAHRQMRIVCTVERKYKVCEAFENRVPVATPSVAAERLEETWCDFDSTQTTKHRALMSALQIPIYVERDGTRRVLGVLSLDADKPDVFLTEEISLWIEELVGYLANLAFAETLWEYRRRVSAGRASQSPGVVATRAISSQLVEKIP